MTADPFDALETQIGALLERVARLRRERDTLRRENHDLAARVRGLQQGTKDRQTTRSRLEALELERSAVRARLQRLYDRLATAPSVAEGGDDTP